MALFLKYTDKRNKIHQEVVEQELPAADVKMKDPKELAKSFGFKLPSAEDEKKRKLAAIEATKLKLIEGKKLKDEKQANKGKQQDSIPLIDVSDRKAALRK